MINLCSNGFMNDYQVCVCIIVDLLVSRQKKKTTGQFYGLVLLSVRLVKEREMNIRNADCVCGHSLLSSEKHVK